MSPDPYSPYSLTSLSLFAEGAEVVVVVGDAAPGGSNPPLAALAVALGARPPRTQPRLASPRRAHAQLKFPANDQSALQCFTPLAIEICNISIWKCVQLCFDLPTVLGGPRWCLGEGQRKRAARAVSERERVSERDMTVAAPQASEAGLQAAKEKAGVGDSEAPKEATPGAQEEGPAVDVGSAQALFDAVENNSEKDLEVRGLASPRLLCSTLTSPFSPHPRGLVLFFCVCVILTPLGPPDHPERPRGGRLRRSAGGRARQHRSDSSGAARALGARREASEQPAGQHQQLQPGRGHGLALGVLQGRLEERLGALVPRSSIRGESSCFQKQQQQTFSRLTSFFLSLSASLCFGLSTTTTMNAGSRGRWQ